MISFLMKPHHYNNLFQKPLASEVLLTSHMLKVAKLSEESEQSLIPPSGEMNADDTANKSLSRASVQPVTQPKAPTDLKIKKKKNPPSSKPKSPYKVRVILLKKQVTETQHAEVTVATADATKRESGEVKATPRPNRELESALNFPYLLYTLCLHSRDDTIMDELDQKTKCSRKFESPHTLNQRSEQQSYPRLLLSLSLKKVLYLHASAGKSAQSDPLGHLHAEMGILNTKIDQLESIISKKVAEDMKSSIPAIVADTLKEQLPGLPSDALKYTLP
ncbi:hypothetical protein Tco_0073353 [Tanacetum coccineum]